LSPRATKPSDFDEFAKRCLLVAALVGLGVLLWFLWGVLLLIFAAALLAIAIRTLAVPFAKRTPLGMSAAIVVVVSLIVLVLSGTGLMLGTQLSHQLGELWTRLPEFADGAEKFIAQTPLGRTLLRLLPDAETMFSGLTAGTALTAATATLGVLATVLIVIFLGLFFALTPRIYVRGFVALFPATYRPRVERVLADTGVSLRAWLGAQFVAMVVVGAITWIGLLLLGVPLALGLAFLAFLLEFIPVVGPIAAAVPAILVGLSESPMLGVWVALLYLAIQQFEGYVLLPLLQRWAVHLPPALYLIGIVAFGVLFGWIGVLLAAPLMVATTVWVREIYMESMLEHSRKVTES
jgi:predicted PurR-regulated permease PerM